MITISHTLLDADGVPAPALLLALLKRQANLRATRLDELHDYYERSHPINYRRRPKGLPNNRLAHDYAGYIVAMASGYLVGEPVGYACAEEGAEMAFDALSEALQASDSGSVDAELAVNASVYGKAVELCYADAQSNPRMAQIDTRCSFVVYDDTVEHNPLFGVTTRERFDGNLLRAGEYIDLYTPQFVVSMERLGEEEPREIARVPHFFGGVPMVEYWNNARESGDFEGVIPLIDAYDALESDRVNDKQQFTDAILLLKGVSALSSDDTEEIVYNEDGTVTEPSAEQKEKTNPSVRLRQTKTLFLPADGADAGFITKPDAESGNELLRAALNNDIHKLSFVPDLTDEKFSGIASGVSMRYKLLGLEQLTKTKERWFREGLKTRLQLLMHFLNVRGAPLLDVSAIQIQFSRSLPVNDLEIAQTASQLKGTVSDETILKHIPWVDDAEAEIEAVAKQQDATMARQQKIFEGQPFRDEPMTPNGGTGAED